MGNCQYIALFEYDVGVAIGIGYGSLHIYADHHHRHLSGRDGVVTASGLHIGGYLAQRLLTSHILHSHLTAKVGSAYVCLGGGSTGFPEQIGKPRTAHGEHIFAREKHLSGDSDALLFLITWRTSYEKFVIRLEYEFRGALVQRKIGTDIKYELLCQTVGERGRFRILYASSHRYVSLRGRLFETAGEQYGIRYGHVLPERNGIGVDTTYIGHRVGIRVVEEQMVRIAIGQRGKAVLIQFVYDTVVFGLICNVVHIHSAIISRV